MVEDMAAEDSTPLVLSQILMLLNRLMAAMVVECLKVVDLVCNLQTQASVVEDIIKNFVNKLISNPLSPLDTSIKAQL
jgi:hypothetical protein